MLLMILVCKLNPLLLRDSSIENQKKILKSLYHSQKSKVEFMGTNEISVIVKVCVKQQIFEKKFCKSVTDTVLKRIRQASPSMIATILSLNSRLDSSTILESKADILTFINSLIEKKSFDKLKTSEISEFIQTVLEFDKKGLFSGSKVLKDHLLIEGLQSAKRRQESILAQKGPHSKEYNQNIARFVDILKPFITYQMTETFQEKLCDYLLCFPETSKSNSFIFIKVRIALSMIDNYNQRLQGNFKDKGDGNKLKFRIGELKRYILNLNKNLCLALKKSSAVEAMKIYELMASLQAAEELSIPQDIKKIIVSKLVTESYEFNPEELKNHYEILNRTIPNLESLFLRYLDELCFNDYSQTIQMEYHFRKHMNTKYESELDWPEKKEMTPGRFDSYKAIQDHAIEIKPLIKISTLMSNGLLLLSMTSANNLVKERLPQINRDHCTKESLSIIEKLSA